MGVVSECEVGDLDFAKLHLRALRSTDFVPRRPKYLLRILYPPLSGIVRQSILRAVMNNVVTRVTLSAEAHKQSMAAYIEEGVERAIARDGGGARVREGRRKARPENH